MRMMQKFDHSGEETNQRKRRLRGENTENDGAIDGNGDDFDRDDQELRKEALFCQEVNDGGFHLDPPARERPADGNWPHRESLSFTRSLIFYGSGSVTPENEMAARYIEEARSMRKKYHGGGGTRSKLEKMKVVPVPSNHVGEERPASQVKIGDCNVTYDDMGDKKQNANEQHIKSISSEPYKETSSSSAPSSRLEYVFGPNGVVEIYEASDFRRTNNLVTVPSLSSFVTDYQRLVELTSSGAMRSFSFQRLQMLSSAFKMHITINGSAEDEAQSGLLGTDFYRTMKVDNHIHLAAAASAKQFVNFVRDKLENEGDTVVMEDGQTLKEVFQRAGLDSDHLTIDAFNVLADYSVYQRFDNFNSKYSPFRMAQMRKIFLKVDNHIDGRSVVIGRICIFIVFIAPRTFFLYRLFMFHFFLIFA